MADEQNNSDGLPPIGKWLRRSATGFSALAPQAPAATPAQTTGQTGQTGQGSDGAQQGGPTSNSK